MLFDPFHLVIRFYVLACVHLLHIKRSMAPMTIFKILGGEQPISHSDIWSSSPIAQLPQAMDVLDRQQFYLNQQMLTSRTQQDSSESDQTVVVVKFTCNSTCFKYFFVYFR